MAVKTVSVAATNTLVGGVVTTLQEVSVAGDPSPCFYVHFEVLHRERVMKVFTHSRGGF